MSDHGLRELVFRTAEIILRVDLVLSFGPPEFGQEILFFDTAFSEFDANLADFVVSFGLIECAPAIAHLQLDVILLLRDGPRGPVAADNRAAVSIAFAFAI